MILKRVYSEEKTLLLNLIRFLLRYINVYFQIRFVHYLLYYNSIINGPQICQWMAPNKMHQFQTRSLTQESRRHLYPCGPCSRTFYSKTLDGCQNVLITTFHLPTVFLVAHFISTIYLFIYFLFTPTLAESIY